MLNKPSDFDGVQEFRDYVPLPAGNYVCKILKVEESSPKNDSNKVMVKIALDILEGDQAEYFKHQFDTDTRTPKRWPCIVNQLVYDKDNKTSRGFKTFVTSVEKSNPGFTVQWGANFAACFKGKKVGGLFRREEYINNEGRMKWSTKCFMFRSTDALEGLPIPKDKPLNTDDGYNPDESTPPTAPYNAPALTQQQMDDVPF